MWGNPPGAGGGGRFLSVFMSPVESCPLSARRELRGSQARSTLRPAAQGPGWEPTRRLHYFPGPSHTHLRVRTSEETKDRAPKPQVSQNRNPGPGGGGRVRAVSKSSSPSEGTPGTREHGEAEGGLQFEGLTSPSPPAASVSNRVCPNPLPSDS